MHIQTPSVNQQVTKQSSQNVTIHPYIINALANRIDGCGSHWGVSPQPLIKGQRWYKEKILLLIEKRDKFTITFCKLQLMASLNATHLDTT